MPEGARTLDWLLDRKSVDDLKATQSLIDHANQAVSSDFRKVVSAMQAVQEVRASLDKDLSYIRAQLAPLCQSYSQTRSELLIKQADGGPSAADRCQRAQGAVQPILALGSKISGCGDSCRAPANELNASRVSTAALGECEHGPCHSQLSCLTHLEDMVGSLRWPRRDKEVRDACGDPGFRLALEPPASVTEVLGGKEVAAAAMPCPLVKCECRRRPAANKHLRNSFL